MSQSEHQTDQAASPSGNSFRISQHFPAIFLAILCGVVFYEAATTLAEQGYASGTPISNAALYPRLLAGLLLSLLALQVASDIWATKPFASDEAPAAPGQIRQTGFVAVAIIIYIVLLPVFGFLLATPLFVLTLLLLLGDRNRATLIAVPLGVTLGCLLVFQGLFNVNLPRGLLGLALNF